MEFTSKHLAKTLKFKQYCATLRVYKDMKAKVPNIRKQFNDNLFR